MKYEDENSYGRLETKPDESLETKSRQDAEGRSASIAPRSLWDEENEASGRTKPSSGYEDLHWKRSPDLYSSPDDSIYETAKTERTKASSCPKDQQTKNMTSSLPIRRKERKTLVFATSSDESEEEGIRSEGVTIRRTRSRQKRSENSSSRRRENRSSSRDRSTKSKRKTTPWQTPKTSQRTKTKYKTPVRDSSSDEDSSSEQDENESLIRMSSPKRILKPPKFDGMN